MVETLLKEEGSVSSLSPMEYDLALNIISSFWSGKKENRIVEEVSSLFTPLECYN
jgi:hypothetical protein